MRIGLVGAGRIGAFHAKALRDHEDVAELLVADADPARSADLAASLGAVDAGSVDAVFGAGVDAVVITSATAAHAELIGRAARAGLPAFCEKPIATDLPGTVAALREVEAAGSVLQIGFQRRFDAGYRAAREAVRAGKLGRLHTVRAITSDPEPPPAAYVPLSGGLYRDCLIHDFDILRWVTGREVAEVYATGSNGGADFFAASGDVDTAAALLTLDDGTLATATATRYNGAGYDVRMELAGEDDQLAVGVDARTPLTSTEPDGAPAPAHPWGGFLERFAPAYRAELRTFVDVVKGATGNPCEGGEALKALLVAEACEVSRREHRPVQVAEIAEHV
ncbi:Gfo/Idh/MocA family oxidoreductase [Streptomyces sp. PTM05]|uniref:Gfo/Idh/MocA family oxidoreductase n=1 Tax=Streptantibioticus parmotrematis TaxID=2873249 RepID=A0ABS7QSF8_9ACTN|nr:Gfo/Idh/MocA family oxidoreductase [Streptantibioticus parmotrematis]MBY8885858.1 Gfo/Idh/MocA family oxidoreductase [Streptantibioticus parmotrematis]